MLRPAPHTFDVAALIPLAAALLFGLSALLTRRLTRTESVFAILFWMMTIQFPVNLVGAFALMPATAAMPMPTALEVAAMCTLAMGGLCSQLCLSKALQIGQAIIVVPLDFVRVPLIALIGWALYMEPIDLWVFVGSIVIFVGILISILPSQKSDFVIEALRSTD